MWASTPRTLHLILWGLLAEVLSQVLLPHTRVFCSWLSWWSPNGEVHSSAPSNAELLAVNFLGAALSGFITAFEMLPGVATESYAGVGDEEDSMELGNPCDPMEAMSLMRHVSSESLDGVDRDDEALAPPPELTWKDVPSKELVDERVPSKTEAWAHRRACCGSPAASTAAAPMGGKVHATPPRIAPTWSGKLPLPLPRLPPGDEVRDPCLRTADAFKNGFVPVWTSYLAVVEHIGSLIAGHRWYAALASFTAAFLGGPVVFTVALVTGRWGLQRMGCAGCGGARCRSSSPEQRVLYIKAAVFLAAVSASVCALVAESAAMMPYPEAVGVTWKVPADGHEAKRRQEDMSAPYLWWQLPWGVCGVVAALLAGDLVGQCTEGRQPLPRFFPGVNWRAAAQNAAALMVGHVLLILEELAESPAKRARLRKAHQTAGGTLSAYSGFVETVGVAAWRGDWQRALANLAVNAYLAGLSVLIALQLGY